MGESLFLWLSPFLSLLVARRWDLPPPNFEKLCLYSKVDTDLIDPSKTGKGMLESSLREEIQRYCLRKFISMKISKGMLFSRKRWCCATGAKLVICLARIVLLSLPLKKILVCLSLSRVVLFHRIKTLYNLTLLQRFFLALNFPTTFCSDGGYGWER